tara:strand:- start:8507 stop:9160 length:654 start_codon:yes stop_codon:yes gene_type:complete
LANNLHNLFNLELILRVLSLIIFVPVMIVPLIYSNLLLVFVYLLFNAIILQEIFSLKSKSSHNNIFNITITIITFTFFLFILSKITEYLVVRLIIEIILIIWIFDTFSFIGGKILGGKKLIPSISSGKTVSGLLIGISVTLLLSQIYKTIAETELNLFFIILIIFFSFFGDLSASLLKRISYTKDSGSIMPGHGGLLDRLDSFLGVFFMITIINIFI